MATYQGRSMKKKTGGKKRPLRSNRKFELGNRHLEAKVGTENKVKKIRTRGGNQKLRAMTLKEVNVLDPETKKYTKTELISVKENVANPHFVRRNTITKGAIIETKAGIAKVANRPGQDGMVNAILVKQS